MSAIPQSFVARDDMPRDVFHQKLSTKVNLIVFAASFLTAITESNKMKQMIVCVRDI